MLELGMKLRLSLAKNNFFFYYTPLIRGKTKYINTSKIIEIFLNLEFFPHQQKHFDKNKE